MTTIDSIIPLLIQVPLVGVFMWFVLEINKRQAEERERRDKEWRDFLIEERLRRGEASLRLAEEMKALAALVTASNTLIIQHDTWERIEIEKRFPT